MAFSWADALRVAAIGFVGVFVILIILAVCLQFMNVIVRKLPTKPLPEKRRE